MLKVRKMGEAIELLEGRLPALDAKSLLEATVAAGGDRAFAAVAQRKPLLPDSSSFKGLIEQRTTGVACDGIPIRSAHYAKRRRGCNGTDDVMGDQTKPTRNGSNLDFEAKLWAAADGAAQRLSTSTCSV